MDTKRTSFWGALIVLAIFLYQLFCSPPSSWLISLFDSVGKALEFYGLNVNHLIETIPILVAGIILIPIIWFLVWYFGLRLLLECSKHCKYALAGLTLAILLITFGLSIQRDRSEWKSNSLNPDRPGFKPIVVVLSGTLNDRNGFEIRMHGRDYYYCKIWHGDEWVVGSSFTVELAIPGFSSRHGLRYTFHAIQGGGGSWFLPDDLIPARRLWNETGFIGAQTNSLADERNTWHLSEEFSDLEKFGPFLIPRTIKYSEGNERVETYKIKKVEFWNWPSTNWYWQIKQKYFDYSTNGLNTDLNEPGFKIESR